MAWLGTAPTLSPSPPAGLYHLTGLSPPGYGPGVLTSRGEQYFSCLPAGLTPKKPDKDSLASRVWQAGQWRPVSAAAPSRCQHTWPLACLWPQSSAPVPTRPSPPTCVATLTHRPAPHPRPSGWVGLAHSRQVEERGTLIALHPTPHGAAHFCPWKEGTGDSTTAHIPEPFSPPLGS